MEDLHVFNSDTLRLVCISDTHNDDPTPRIPPGDIFIHAGDMTDDGTYEELKTAFKWLCELHFKVKVVIAGNHDVGLDRKHPSWSSEAVALFRSQQARSHGIHYLDQETRAVAFYRPGVPLRIYGNALTPDFLNSNYGFTYEPAPSRSATEAWKSAPAPFHSVAGNLEQPGVFGGLTTSAQDYVPVQVTHGAPLHHLDRINIPGLSGCAVQAEMVAQSRPLLCVFGHYHVSRGVEVTEWDEPESQGGTASQAGADVEGEERRDHRHGGSMIHEPWELVSKPTAELEEPNPIVDVHGDAGSSTTFVNAAWMTGKKRETPKRNAPFIVILRRLVLPTQGSGSQVF